MATTSTTLDPMAFTVASPSLWYRRMVPGWELIHDLLAGTQAMRDRGELWLPKQKAEQTNDYDNRKKQTFLFGAYSDTLDKISGRPFVKPIAIRSEEELSDTMRRVIDDPDGSGRSLTAWSRDVFRDAVNYGVTHVVVDFPSLGRTLSRAEESAFGVQPKLLHIPTPDLIGARRFHNSSILEQVRIRESSVEPIGDFGERETIRIRVWRPNEWALFERPAKSDMIQGEEWIQIDGGPNTFGEIPLVSIYFNRTGWMSARPILEDLAWLNLAHYQSLSDQRNILHFARIAILYGTGIRQDELAEQGVTIGANRILVFENHNARLGFAEHSGAAIGAGAEDIRRLEDRMEILGLKPLIERSGGVTATAQAISESRTDTDIKAWVRVFERALVEMLNAAARWIGEELPEDFGVDVHDDFTISHRAQTDIQALIAMRTSSPPQISRQTFHEELKRRGIFSEFFSSEDEAERIELEGADLAPAPADEDDDDDALPPESGAA